MKLPQSTPLAIAVLTGVLVIGGMGGAIAAGQIGTHDIRNGAVTKAKLHGNAVTSAKIHNRTVKATDLAKSARGAKVIEYTASGSAFPGTVDVQLPGTWDATKLANSGWSVELVRNGPPSFLFALGQSAPSGEGPNDGFYIIVDSAGSATVHIAGPSYGSIDTIRVVRTISTSQAAGTLARGVHPAGPQAAR
jgi:hypothetical protein